MKKKDREYGLIKRLVFAFMRITQINSISNWMAGRLWLRPAFYCLVAVAVVGLATLTDQFFPRNVWFEVSQKAIKDLLSIIASSMLAVAIFSVSVMNSSYASAINASTPRAVDIVIADTIDEFVSQAEQMVENYSYTNQIGKNARKTIASNYDNKFIVNNLVQFFKQLTA